MHLTIHLADSPARNTQRQYRLGGWGGEREEDCGEERKSGDRPAKEENDMIPEIERRRLAQGIISLSMATTDFRQMDEIRCSSYQVIIVVTYDDGRLFPLTEDCPKCLLPIANREVLSYQLDVIKQSGATEIFVVAPQEYHSQLSHFTAQYTSELVIEVIPVAEMIGSADGIRAISDRIRGDFIVFNSDTLSQINLGELVHLHRIRTSDVTMLLSAVPLEESDKKGVCATLKIDEEDQEYIALTSTGRVAMKTPVLELDLDGGAVSLGKPLLRHFGGGGGVSLRCDVIDSGIYVMSHWLMEFLLAKRNLSSLRNDVMPYLVSRQSQPASTLLPTLPGLQHRRRPLRAIDPWLLNLRSTVPSTHSPPFDADSAIHGGVAADMSETIRRTCLSLPQGSAGGSGGALSRATSDRDSSFGRADDVNDDLLRCFSLLVESPSPASCSSGGSKKTPSEKVPGMPICQRITNLQNYMTLNRDVPLMSGEVAEQHSLACVRLTHPQPLLKKEQSVIGEGCVLGEKITIKNSAIGSDCKIAAKSKINSCVIMGHVEIGEGCTIQNSVISEGTVIGSNCNINECFTGRRVCIRDGSKIKGETISAADADNS